MTTVALLALVAVALATITSAVLLARTLKVLCRMHHHQPPPAIAAPPAIAPVVPIRTALRPLPRTIAA